MLCPHLLTTKRVSDVEIRTEGESQLSSSIESRSYVSMCRVVLAVRYEVELDDVVVKPGSEALGLVDDVSLVVYVVGQELHDAICAILVAREDGLNRLAQILSLATVHGQRQARSDATKDVVELRRFVLEWSCAGLAVIDVLTHLLVDVTDLVVEKLDGDGFEVVIPVAGG